MGIRLDRRVVIAAGKRDEAIAFATQVSAYVSGKYVPVRWGLEMGGTNGAIHWYADYDSMAHVEQVLAESMQDPDYTAILDRANDLFVANAEDTLVWVM
jgi:hypothetical protein